MGEEGYRHAALRDDVDERNVIELPVTFLPRRGAGAHAHEMQVSARSVPACGPSPTRLRDTDPAPILAVDALHIREEPLTAFSRRAVLVPRRVKIRACEPSSE